MTVYVESSCPRSIVVGCIVLAMKVEGRGFEVADLSPTVGANFSVRI